MNETAQRITIAEWMGWSDIGFVGLKDARDYRGTHENSRPEGATGKWQSPVPDYTRDRNAIADAETYLLASKPGYYDRSYVSAIQSVLGQDPDDAPDKRQVCELVTATASQRAEALLRTLGLWKEEA